MEDRGLCHNSLGVGSRLLLLITETKEARCGLVAPHICSTVKPSPTPKWLYAVYFQLILTLQSNALQSLLKTTRNEHTKENNNNKKTTTITKPWDDEFCSYQNSSKELLKKQTCCAQQPCRWHPCQVMCTHSLQYGVSFIPATHEELKCSECITWLLH